MSERFAKRMAILLLIAVVLVAITNEGYPLRSLLDGSRDDVHAEAAPRSWDVSDGQVRYLSREEYERIHSEYRTRNDLD